MKKLFLLFTMLAMVLISKAQTDLIISEYVEGWSNNKALEIFNPTNASINLSNYRLVRYGSHTSGGSDVPPALNAWACGLPNRNLLPYHSYVVVLDMRDPLGTGQDAPVWAQLAQRADTFACPVYEESWTMYFNGNDAVSIEKKSGAEWLFIDIFGSWGEPAPAPAAVPGSTTKIQAWTDVSPFFTGEGIALTADHTLIRKSSVKEGVKSNPPLFNTLAQYDSLPANTFNNLGWHKYDGAPVNSTPVLTMTNSLFFVSPTAENGTILGTLTASDTEGEVVRFYNDYGNFVYVDDGNPTIPDKRYEPFGLDRNTGALTVVNKLGLLPAIKSMFYLKTTVTDGLSQSAPQDILVIVAEPITAINIGPSGGSSISTHNGTLQFIAESFPAVTFDPTLRYKWKVSDENIAGIDAAGLVTAKKNGKVNVICAAIDGSGVEGVYELTITGQPLPVTGLTIYSATGASTITVDYATLQFTAEVEPSFALDPETRFMWMVSDEAVATISESGLLTPKGNGSVNVICMATDGSGVESQFPVIISNQTVSVPNQKISPVIYPNPVDGNQFRITTSKEIKTIVITDVASREVYRKSFKAGVVSSDVEMASDFKGVFMVSVIYNDNSRGVSKLVVR